MNSCNATILLVFLLFAGLACVYVSQNSSIGIGNGNGDEDFYIGSSYIRNAAPYYTTTFQAYPGKYMRYSSNRASYCLQQHQEYAGYRNCMLYLE